VAAVSGRRGGRVALGRDLVVAVGRPRLSGRVGERFQAREGGGELGGPGPGGRQAQAGAAGVEREARGDVEQAVAQALGLGLGELAGQQQALGPGDQVVRERDEREPDAVVLEVAERQVPEAGVLVVADVVFDAGAGAVVAFDGGDVAAGLVGQDGLEAVPVGVAERQLRAGMRALAPDEDPGPGGPGRQVESLGDLADLPVGALGAGLVKRARPALAGCLEDRGADRFGDLVADGEPDLRLARPVEQLGSRSGGQRSSGAGIGWPVRSAVIAVVR
jgi:hypothetical protein